MRTIEVTEEEYYDLVATRKSKQKARDSIAADLLDVAITYHNWLSDNGAGDTFSTFCNDFGYVPINGQDQAIVHSNVSGILKYVRSIAKNEAQ